MHNLFQVPIRCAALIDAPVGPVRRALGRSQVWSRAARAVGGRLEVAGDPDSLTSGALVRFRSAHGYAVLLRVDHQDGLPVFRTAMPGHLRVEITLVTASTGAGTLVTVEILLSSPIPLLSNIFRPVLVRYGEMLLGITTLAAREPVRVVAGALISEGRVLLARRRMPSGQWELPGGKVEPGESDHQALQRELLEELSVHTMVHGRIGPIVQVEPGVILLCYRAELAAAGPIVLIDHDDHRWAGPEELESFDLLDADRQLADSLRGALQERSPGQDPG